MSRTVVLSALGKRGEASQSAHVLILQDGLRGPQVARREQKAGQIGQYHTTHAHNYRGVRPGFRESRGGRQSLEMRANHYG